LQSAQDHGVLADECEKHLIEHAKRHRSSSVLLQCARISRGRDTLRWSITLNLAVFTKLILGEATMTTILGVLIGLVCLYFAALLRMPRAK
jgi:hypothetical protein